MCCLRRNKYCLSRKNLLLLCTGTPGDSRHAALCLFLMRQTIHDNSRQEDEREVERFPTQEAQKLISFGLQHPPPGKQRTKTEQKQRRDDLPLARRERSLWILAQQRPYVFFICHHRDDVQSCDGPTQLTTTNCPWPFCHRAVNISLLVVSLHFSNPSVTCLHQHL